MHVLDVILRAGDPQCISDAQANSFRIRTLEGFAYHHIDGTDKGEGVRGKARTVSRLLEDPQVLEAEREKAVQLRRKLWGYGGGCSDSGSGKYDGISSGRKGGNYGSYSCYDLPSKTAQKTPVTEKSARSLQGTIETEKKEPNEFWEDRQQELERRRQVRIQRAKAAQADKTPDLPKKHEEVKVPLVEVKVPAETMEKTVVVQKPQTDPLQHVEPSRISQDLLQIFSFPPQSQLTEPAPAKPEAKVGVKVKAQITEEPAVRVAEPVIAEKGPQRKVQNSK